MNGWGGPQPSFRACLGGLLPREGVMGWCEVEGVGGLACLRCSTCSPLECSVDFNLLVGAYLGCMTLGKNLLENFVISPWYFFNLGKILRIWAIEPLPIRFLSLFLFFLG